MGVEESLEFLPENKPASVSFQSMSRITGRAWGGSQEAVWARGMRRSNEGEGGGNRGRFKCRLLLLPAIGTTLHFP